MGLPVDYPLHAVITSPHATVSDSVRTAFVVPPRVNSHSGAIGNVKHVGPIRAIFPVRIGLMRLVMRVPVCPIGPGPVAASRSVVRRGAYQNEIAISIKERERSIGTVKHHRRQAERVY